LPIVILGFDHHRVYLVYLCSDVEQRLEHQLRRFHILHLSIVPTTFDARKTSSSVMPVAARVRTSTGDEPPPPTSWLSTLA
jgi:hypothetical protein